MRSLSRAFSLTLLVGLASSVFVSSVVRAEDPPGFAAATAANRMLCVHDVAAGQTLTMRSAASGTATTVAELPAGTCGLKLAGSCEGDWCEMSLADRRGWVPWRFVGIYEVPSASQSVIARPEPQPRRSTEAPPPASSAPRAGAPPVSSRPPEPPRRTAAATASRAHKAPVPRRSAVARLSHPSPPRHAYAPQPPAAPWWSSGLVGRSVAAFGFGSSCVVRVAWWDRLNIRTGPGVDHDTVGAIPPGFCGVARAGGCQGDWCRVAWRGRTGWVNTFYLE